MSIQHPTEFLTFQGIETRFHGPTNHCGARVSARYLEHREGDPVLYTEWDYRLDSIQNHAIAAGRIAAHSAGRSRALGLRAYPLAKFTTSTNRGYVFLLDWRAEVATTKVGA